MPTAVLDSRLSTLSRLCSRCRRARAGAQPAQRLTRPDTRESRVCACTLCTMPPRRRRGSGITAVSARPAAADPRASDFVRCICTLATLLLALVFVASRLLFGEQAVILSIVSTFETGGMTPSWIDSQLGAALLLLRLWTPQRHRTDPSMMTNVRLCRGPSSLRTSSLSYARCRPSNTPLSLANAVRASRRQCAML